MMPKELQTEAQAIKALVGSKADIALSVNVDGLNGSQPCQFGIWPNGLTSSGCLFIYADDWPGLFAKVRAEWAQRAAIYDAELVERMALAIISITARTGGCSEAALRAEFDSSEIARVGEAAVEKANAMAANGPFSIERSANSNAPEGEAA